MNLYPDENERLRLFPIAAKKRFLAHAAVTALPRPVADAVCNYTTQSCEQHQEFGDVLRDVKDTRRVCAEIIGAHADEIALLGPTSLGLSLFANGIPWEAGDEVVCYGADYPANVYPWLELQRRGVIVRQLKPEKMGEITVDLVKESLTPKTRLVALASCNFFNGYQIDVNAIGRMLHDHGVLFSLDAIQTLGAFPVSVEYVDFLSADAHKWMLGPLAIGIVYVKKCHFDFLRPTLLGAWNVQSPNFIAQDEIRFVPTAQRYEPGVLNVAGILGMRAALELIAGIGVDRVAARLLELKKHLVGHLEEFGFTINGMKDGAHASSITTFHHDRVPAATLYERLEKADVVSSLRHDRDGNGFLRFSPHLYNTEAELDHALDVMRKLL